MKHIYVLCLSMKYLGFNINYMTLDNLIIDINAVYA